MSRPIAIDPEGGVVEVAGEILEPGPAPLKIDIWRRVRHPPPELIHVRAVKELRATRRNAFVVGEPAALIGKVITWTWVCSHLPASSTGWRVRVDVMQRGVSLRGYPVEYAGPLPGGRPLAELSISEPFVEAGR